MMKGVHTFTGGFRVRKTERTRETDVKFWRKQLSVGCLRKYSDIEETMLFKPQVLFALSV